MLKSLLKLGVNLDDRSIKCILLGYSSQNKGYKLQKVSTGDMLIFRDVIFQDQQFSTKIPQPHAAEFLDTHLQSDPLFYII